MNRVNTVKKIEACLDELYRESTPSITWEQIKKKYSGTKIQFYLAHFLPEAKYVTITNKYRKLGGAKWVRDLEWALLDYAPITSENLKMRKLNSVI